MSVSEQASQVSTAPRRRVKICLAASGGGHLRQMTDIQKVWEPHDAFIVSERSILAETLGRKHRAHFVHHYAFGQIGLGKPFAMMTGMVRNFFQSIRIALKERPDVVITTGAAAVFWTCLFCRLLGARLIVIESFARFDGPSVFGRLIKRFASDLVVQSSALKAKWPEAHLFDPFRMLDGPRPKKQPLVFATVGATLPFDRLVDAVLEARQKGAIPERLVLQTGTGCASQLPKDDAGLTCVETLDFDDLQALLVDAELVIAHAGTGSLITALRQGCRVVAMPRLHSKGEVYDDHQLEIVEAFQQRGLIEYAADETELISAIERARARTPVMATTEPKALSEWLEIQIQAVARSA